MAIYTYLRILGNEINLKNIIEKSFKPNKKTHNHGAFFTFSNTSQLTLSAFYHIPSHFSFSITKGSIPI
jgi:hypothetical protein